MRDRLSWIEFLGFKLGEATPDESTIRHFRNCLTETEAFDLVHELFKKQLRDNGFLLRGDRLLTVLLLGLPDSGLPKRRRKRLMRGNRHRRYDRANPTRLRRRMWMRAG